MRLGTAMPFAGIDGSGSAGTAMADAARHIETLGYSSLWTFDAVGRGFVLPDPLMALSVAATATTEIELGTFQPSPDRYATILEAVVGR